ncbi:MAG: PAS domain S-box protein, partial [Candidatus Thermoplasmatota archaeon]|nr:PAS domain S-box protein [Candidatus Thermoplasmatota archaeon]
GVNREWTMGEKRVAYEIADHVSVLFASDNKRKIESQIKELKEFNESLVNNMTDGIIIEGKDGHIKFTNPAMSKLVGSPAGFLRGSHWKDIVAPDYHGVVEEADLRREEGVSDSYGIELLRSDGSRVPALVSGIPNFQGGRYDGLMAIFTDIRELKNVQSELAVRSAYFQNLFENSPEAVILISNDGLIKRINKAFTTMFGYKEEECLGQMVDDFIVPTESKEYAVRLTMNSIKGMRMREDVLRKKKDGSLVDVSLTSSPIFTEDGQIGVYAIYRDISKEKGAERALMNERNRSEFYLDLLSHDIGNLHQGISTALQLSRIKGLDDKNGSIAFETAEELVQRSMHLVKNVIFLANIDTRQVKTKTIEVVSMMENTISHVVKLFQSKKISLELDLPGGPIHIVAEDIVEELFFNILHNGLK